MTNSITADKNKGKRQIRIWAIAFWLLIWQIVSVIIGQEILLVSPITVFITLIKLCVTKAFWSSIGFTFIRIAGGFCLATLVGILLATLSARFVRIKELLYPAMLAIKSTPVASFIILILIWIPSKNISIVISFLMGLPIIYTNVLTGINQTDVQILEMAQVFKLSPYKKIRYIYLSYVLPYFQTGCLVSLGMCFKAGIAAEVIGIPKNSIGEQLYNSKVYLITDELFAWTITVILISLLFEKVFLKLIDVIVKRLERM